MRGQGRPSQADRPFEKSEFDQAIKILQSYPDFNNRYLYPTIFRFQFHLEARLDDTVHLMKETIRQCPQFGFALRTRLRWSKNVQDEREAPEQIMLAAMDPLYCIYIALGIYLEIWTAGEGSIGTFVFAPEGSDPNNVKSQAYNALKDKVIDSSDFIKAPLKEKLGTHSIRKYGYTHARCSGCSKDDTDYRGRWREDPTKKQRTSSVYEDPMLPWPDVKVASKLCMGGPIKYSLKDGSGLSDNWVVTNVSPHIASTYSMGVAAILGKAILWAMFDDIANDTDRVPMGIHQRIMSAYHLVPDKLPDDENPVKKI